MMVFESIVILTLWIASLVLPLVLTPNEKYLNQRLDEDVKKAKKESHFLRQ